MLNHGIVPASGGDYEIDNSLRFNDDDSAYLSWTPSSAGNRKKITVSVWAKRGKLGASNSIISSGGRFDTAVVFDSNDKIQVFTNYAESYRGIQTSAVFRDTSAWYHIVATWDTNNSTSTDRHIVWVNGVRQAVGSETTMPQNGSTELMNTTEHIIGTGGRYEDNNRLDAYLAEMHVIDGQVLTPADFGETGDYGEWKPIEVEGLTYGTNGFYLDFSDSAALGDDAANSNDFTVNNLTASDQVLDTPTNNFATLNSLIPDTTSRLTFSEGNLKVVEVSNSANYPTPRSSIGVTSGKWYSEFIFTTSTVYYGVAVVNDSNDAGSYPHASAGGYGYFKDGLKKSLSDSEGAAYGDTFTTGDVIGTALDMDNGNLFFYKNGVVQNSGTAAYTGLSGNMRFVIYLDDATGLANFGQDSSFAGNKTAQGETDSNGIGDFYYTPPTDFLALCTSNLPDSAVIPSKHFNTVLYSGNGTTQSITGVNFQPDFTWIKQRSGTRSHGFLDSIRGGGEVLFSNNDAAEASTTNTITSFDSDGFSLGNQTMTNESGTYVAWNWKAGTSVSGDTAGSGTAKTYTGSVNADAGFSIIAYEGNGTAGHTVSHHLNSAPEMLIVKSRTVDNKHWATYHIDLGNTVRLDLERNVAKITGTGAWNSTTPTSSLVTFGTTSDVNTDAADHIMYAFHSVEGFSRCGKYEGNNDADGAFVYTGFRPAWIMVKASSTGGTHYDWAIYDTARSSYNAVGHILEANQDQAEVTGTGRGLPIDIVSNGFKFRSSYAESNAAQTYIYLAFAEQPFKHSNAR